MPSQSFVNGRVFLGTGESDFASAFTVTDGRFGWVGDADGLDDADPVDLGGAVVLPGLLDVHTHPAFLATLAQDLSLFPPAVACVADLVERLREHPALGAGAGAWVTGFGYSDSDYPEGAPTRADLDAVSSVQPVFVRRADGHTAVCNSFALELAGLTAASPDPADGWLGRDPVGALTGQLVEWSAVDLVYRLAPPVGRDELARRIAGLNDHYASLGIVAVDELLATFVDDPWELFCEAERQGYRVDTGLFLGWRPDLPDLTADQLTGRVRVAGAKLFLDGAFSNRTAWVEEPYPGTTSHGLRTGSDEDLRAAVDWARRNRVQVAIHAMGDRAISHAVALFEDQPGWLGDRPSIRLEHCTLATPAMLDRLVAATMDFGVVSHTIFWFAEAGSYVQALSPRTADYAYPIRSYLERLPAFALSSDSPTTAWADCDDVFVSVAAAVTRRAATGAVLGPQEAVRLGQALQCYTGRAAQVTTCPDVGTIEVGGRAHFVVLDSDPFRLGPDELSRVRIAQTWMDGELVFQR